MDNSKIECDCRQCDASSIASRMVSICWMFLSIAAVVLCGIAIIGMPAEARIDCTIDQRNEIFLSAEFLACTEIYEKSCYEIAQEKHCATKESGL